MPYSKDNQIGRSMVEIIGVLAIIGVLSVGGIAGYSKAMEKLNLQKTVENFAEIIRNVSKMYDSQKGFGELDNKEAIKIGFLPSTMIKGDKTIASPLGADVIIKSVDRNRKTFVIVYNNLKSAECQTLAIQDWQGTIGAWKFLITSPSGIIPPRGSPSTLDAGEFGADKLPISLENAAKYCQCNPNFGCGLAWFFTAE